MMLEHPPQRIGFAVTSWFLAVTGGVLAYLFGSAAAESTASCLPDETPFPCTETGRQVIFWLPISGWILAILFGWLVGAQLIRHRKPRWPAIPAGVVVYAAGMVADWFVAVR